MPALDLYRSTSGPPRRSPSPTRWSRCAVICADDDERARFLAGPARLSFAAAAQRAPARFPTPEEADGARVHARRRRRSSTARGVARRRRPREGARRARAPSREQTRADELMLTTMVHAHGRPAALLRAPRRGDGCAAAPERSAPRRIYLGVSSPTLAAVAEEPKPGAKPVSEAVAEATRAARKPSASASGRPGAAADPPTPSAARSAAATSFPSWSSTCAGSRPTATG